MPTDKEIHSYRMANETMNKQGSRNHSEGVTARAGAYSAAKGGRSAAPAARVDAGNAIEEGDQRSRLAIKLDEAAASRFVYGIVVLDAA